MVIIKTVCLGCNGMVRLNPNKLLLIEKKDKYCYQFKCSECGQTGIKEIDYTWFNMFFRNGAKIVLQEKIPKEFYEEKPQDKLYWEQYLEIKKMKFNTFNKKFFNFLKT